MANAEYERARARARLALIAPTVDDVTAAYFDSQVEKVLLEARQNGEKSDQELISTLLDAVARKYFAMGLRDQSRARMAITSRARMAITSRARIGITSKARMTVRRIPPRQGDEGCGRLTSFERSPDPQPLI